jgi:uncharacterized RDD family membrane protein YckC
MLDAPGSGALVVRRHWQPRAWLWWKGSWMSAQVVNLPPGVNITSAGRRLLAALLDGLLVIFTLWIGWFIWSLFTYKTGQTPAKKIMGMRMVYSQSGVALNWGMSVVRDYIVKGFIGGLTLGIAYLWILFDPRKQALYDKLMDVIVVDDPSDATLPTAYPGAPAQTF